MDFLTRTIEALTQLDTLQASQLTTVLLIIGILAFMWLWNKRQKQTAGRVELATKSQDTQRLAQTDINLKLINLVQAQVDNNEAITLQMTKNEESYRDVGKLIGGLTTALTKFTRTISDKMEGFGKSIEELEATIITHIEQEQRNHDALISSQSFHSDGVTGLRNEISALTGQISVLINSIHTRDTANSDVGLKVDNLASEVRLLTQAVEARQAITENENKPLEASNE